MWILLEVGHLKNFENFFNEPYQYGFKCILDDKIINSQQLVVLNVRFDIFYCILCFNLKFENLSSIKSHQE